MTGRQASRLTATMHDGSRVAFTMTQGDGSPVVLIHGGAGSRRDWDRVVSLIARCHRVVAVDMVGFGESDRPPGRYTPGRLGDSVTTVMDELGIGCAHLVGHSLGGRVALEIARRYPQRTGRLALLAPMGFGRITAPGFAFGLLHWSLHRIALKSLPYPDLEFEMDDDQLKASAGVSAITSVMWGARDPILPSRYAQRVASAIPGASVETFETARHAPHREAPSEFADRLLNFLADS